MLFVVKLGIFCVQLELSKSKSFSLTASNESKSLSKRTVRFLPIIPINLYKKQKYSLLAFIFSGEWPDLTWPNKSAKFNLHYLLKTSMIFKMVVLTPKSDIQETLIKMFQQRN